MLDQDHAVPEGAASGGAPALDVMRYRPQFSGRAGEYFGIWIVNVLLTILTLGIYSAWAKVRTERYFYANTRLAGSSFDYLADPIRILKGRLIAYAVVIALGLSSQFMPVVYLLLLLALFACMPLIVFLSARFRARYSAWRGVRFRFTGSAGAAYGPFLGWPILSSLTLTALYPLMKRRQHEYLVSGHKFGTAAFGFESEAGPYYRPWLVAAGCAIVAFGLFMVAIFGVAFIAALGGSEEQSTAVMLVMVTVFMLVLYFGMFVLMVYLRTRYTNLMWNSARLGEHRFQSSLNPAYVLWLYLGNLVAILCTLGLATPWAMVRLARYRAECFELVATGGIDDFVADADADRGAAGAELSDALDLGVDIGI